MKRDELNAYKADVTIPVYGTIADAEVYLKEKVDAIIAEKDAEIAELKAQVHDYAQGLYVMQARAEKEARHHKYKRCLAMAEACRHKRWRGGIGEEGYNYARATRHMNMWLELAEKFKLNKSTTQ